MFIELLHVMLGLKKFTYTLELKRLRDRFCASDLNVFTPGALSIYNFIRKH